jgi:phosphoribosylamine--glycine ligase
MGDPETQPIMVRLKTDLVKVMEHAVEGTLDQIELEWDRRTALGVVMAAANYPESPRKGGDYVHVVAQQAITVCIMDGQERAAILNLQDGEGRSIYGPSPFRVYSSDFQGLKVYFQGQQIKLAKQDTQQIKLTAATYMPLKN